jgi:hypothetical protein
VKCVPVRQDSLGGVGYQLEYFFTVFGEFWYLDSLGACGLAPRESCYVVTCLAVNSLSMDVYLPMQ